MAVSTPGPHRPASGRVATPAAAPTPAVSGVDEASVSDVLVVGAGPTGLLLAGDLAAAGHRVVLVERRAETVGNLSRALVVHARTLEQFDARDVADELVATGEPMEEMRLFSHAVLHPDRLPSRFPYVLVTGQFEVERVLLERAVKAGVVFRNGTEVTGLRQDADGVELDVRPAQQDGAQVGARGRASGEPPTAPGAGTLRASYAVGTDGAHSTVREALGLPFPGKSVVRSIVLADVRLAEPPPAAFVANAIGGSFAIVGSFGDGWFRVAGWNRRRQLPDDAPVELEEAREFTRQALGSDFGMHSPRWISRFHSDERQAPRYRLGRTLLAGDAAHVHSPAGGMGMNTGLQDSANLSWKLSAVLHGHASSTLLDSYERERHPVGKRVLRLSGGIIRVALADSVPSRGLRAGAGEVLSRVRPLADRALRSISGLDISYAAPRGSHPLVGKRAPDLALSSGRLYEALRAGTFVLVTPRGGQPGMSLPEMSRCLTVESACNDSRTLLIRPDGYIAWASDEPDPIGQRQALEAWTGSVQEPVG